MKVKVSLYTKDPNVKTPQSQNRSNQQVMYASQILCDRPACDAANATA